MESGSWLIADATTDIVFNDDERRWMKLLKQVTLGQWIDPKRIPEDPSVN